MAGWEGVAVRGAHSNFRDVWFDNTPPGLNGCSFNGSAGRDPINRLVLPLGPLARKPTSSTHVDPFSRPFPRLPCARPFYRSRTSQNAFPRTRAGSARGGRVRGLPISFTVVFMQITRLNARIYGPVTRGELYKSLSLSVPQRNDTFGPAKMRNHPNIGERSAAIDTKVLFHIEYRRTIIFKLRAIGNLCILRSLVRKIIF